MKSITKKKIALRPVVLDNYQISGFYYTEWNLKFRKYLHIKHSSSTLESPDLMVIMMNPGSSEPLDKNDNGRVETIAKADPTQRQIIRVMESLNFQFARVLNLSDIREPRSWVFYRLLHELNARGIHHSIFAETRQTDFNELYVCSVPVIYAWGVNEQLIPLAKKAIEMTNKERSFGWNKPGGDFAYYHPLPMRHEKQKEWYEMIEEIWK